MGLLSINSTESFLKKTSWDAMLARNNGDVTSTSKTPSTEPNYSFPLAFGQNVGGTPPLVPVDGSSPVYGVGRTETAGQVTGTDGSLISTGGQGVGLGTVMAQGPGEHSTNGLPRAKHTFWVSA